MDGHATQVGGCIVDSGNFDWMAHKDKFPGLTTKMSHTMELFMPRSLEKWLT